MIRHKFNAKSCEEDGKKFPSKAERNFYLKLKQQQSEGSVLFFLRQPSFDIGAGISYRADFVVFYTDGTVEFIDVKGVETPEFKLKKKLLEDAFPIQLRIVK